MSQPSHPPNSHATASQWKSLHETVSGCRILRKPIVIMAAGAGATAPLLSHEVSAKYAALELVSGCGGVPPTSARVPQATLPSLAFPRAPAAQDRRDSGACGDCAANSRWFGLTDAGPRDVVGAWRRRRYRAKLAPSSPHRVGVRSNRPRCGGWPAAKLRNTLWRLRQRCRWQY